MDDTILTIIIPVKNGENHILRALTCLRNQTFQNFEILIINDASSDKTKDIIESQMKIFEKIKVINLPQNKGVSYCRNLGIKNCNTKYITFLDHDDWIDIHTYEKWYQAIQKNIDIYIFGLDYNYLDIDVVERKYYYQDDFVISADYALKIYGNTIKDSFNITPIVNNKIYKKELLIKNEIYFDDVSYQEDDIFTFKILLCSQNVKFISKCQYHYLQNPNSTIHQVSDLSIFNFIKAYSTLQLFLEKHELFNIFKNEFYLRFKQSIKGTIHRIVQYSENKKELQHLLAELYKKLIQNFIIEDLIGYYDLYNLE